jgi:hypothetical protein
MCNANSWCNSYSKHKKEKGFFKPTKLQLARSFEIFIIFIIFIFENSILTSHIDQPNTKS